VMPAPLLLPSRKQSEIGSQVGSGRARLLLSTHSCDAHPGTVRSAAAWRWIESSQQLEAAAHRRVTSCLSTKEPAVASVRRIAGFSIGRLVNGWHWSMRCTGLVCRCGHFCPRSWAAGCPGVGERQDGLQERPITWSSGCCCCCCSLCRDTRPVSQAQLIGPLLCSGRGGG
jgi:hypothetical protein